MVAIKFFECAPPNNQSLYDLKIITTQGRVVHRESFISSQMFLGAFSPGVYLLSAKNSNGCIVNRTFHIRGF